MLLALVAILLVGFALRVFHVDYADGQLPHPDERSTVAFYAPTIHWPPPGVSPLDKRQSPLNPLWNVERQERRSYTYGHFPLYLLVLTANAVHDLALVAERLGASPETVDSLRRANGVPGFAVVGRVIMAVCDTFTVLLIFLLADHIYGRRRGRWWPGLLAAAFSAFTVLQIQLSHFFAVDPISTTFTALALYAALRTVDAAAPLEADARRGSPAGWAALTGIGAGLAVASKFSALPILAAPVAASAVIWWRQRKRRAEAASAGSDPLLLAALAIAVAFVAFAVTSPFAILDWPNFRQAVLVEQGAMVRGDADFPFTRQYRGTAPYLYFIEQQIRWGIGWPLGLLAFVALGWALVKLALGRAEAGEVILLSWIVPYFGITGLFLAKFMRYMVPVVPFLMVFAAGLVAAIHRSAVTAYRRAAAALVAGVVLLGAILWSLAFVNGVYNNTHPWIKASRWIYANVPDGSTLAWEQWDDSLPYDLPEPNAFRGRYRFIDWGPFEEDTAEKFEWLKRTLRQADYLVLSSNRIYGAVDNLPERYPLTNRYYELLFAGQLGYELALKETNRPRLFGVEIDDSGADESFTLYDHPTVHVFRKVRDLSDAEWDALLGGAWQGARPWYVGERTLISRLWGLFDERAERAAAAPREPGPGEGRSLLLDRPLAELPVLDDFRWNGLASRTPVLAVAVWWLALTILGLAAWPLAFALFTELRDRGYLLARSLGWLVVGYLVWLPASLRIGQNALPFILAALAALALLSFLLWRRQRAEMAAFVAVHRRLLAFGEALFGLAFLFFVGLRILNPDLWQPWNGGEKFMEFAFLNATLRSAYTPPADPYFAGGTINYYYYGYFLINLLIKLTGIWSSVAFNLAIPTAFALTVSNVFSVAYSLAGRAWNGAAVGNGQWSVADGQWPMVNSQWPTADGEGTTGTEGGGYELQVTSYPRSLFRWPAWLQHGLAGALLAVLFVALLGNVDSGGQLLRSLAERSDSSFTSNLPGLQTLVRSLDGLAQVITTDARLPGYRYWDPSRVIPYTINEFPYWSFLFADLHPHMIAIPFGVLFLGLAFNLLARYGAAAATASSTGSPARSPLLWLRRLTGDGLYPAMALTLGALAVINTWDLPTYFGLAVLTWLVREWRSRRMAAAPQASLLRTLLFAAGLGAGAVLLYLPFFRHYQPLASSGVGLAKAKTPLGLWMNMWGLWFFLAVSFVLVALRRRPPSRWPRDPGVVRWLRLAADRANHAGRALALSRGAGQPLAATAAGALAFVGVGLALAVALWLLDYRVPAVLLLPWLLSGLLLLRRSAGPQSLFLTVLTFTGLLVLLGVEFFYLKDHLQGGEWRRMNTLFKFYIQAWVMLALAAGAALPQVWRFVQTRWSVSARAVWTVAFGWLLALSLIFPLLGTSARLDDRFPRENGRPPVGTLDGMAYMTVGTYTWHPDPAQAPYTRIVLRHDYDALRWLLDNVRGLPVVAEAVIGYYREGGLRVASFTGFPTLLGFHQEGEQRYGWQTGPRRSQAEELWTTTDPARGQQLLAELGVDYVYVGQLERIMYSPEALAKFDRLAEQGVLEVAYRNEGVTIYRMR